MTTSGDARKHTYVLSEAKQLEALFDALEALHVVERRAAFVVAVEVAMRAAVGVGVQEVLADPTFLGQPVVHVVEDVKVLFASVVAG